MEEEINKILNINNKKTIQLSLISRKKIKKVLYKAIKKAKEEAKRKELIVNSDLFEVVD